MSPPAFSQSLAGAGHVDVHVPVRDLVVILAGVGFGAGEELEEQDAGGVHVAARIGSRVCHQFWWQVACRADEHPRRGHLRRADASGEAEIHHFELPAVRDEHVLGFDVAVHHPRLVRGGERGCDVFHIGERPLRAQRRLAAHHAPQRFTVDELHHDVGLALRGALIENAHHVLVGEDGGGACLAVELRDEFVVLAEIGAHHFQRDDARQPQVARAIHRGHTATCHFRDDLVATVQHLTDQRVISAAHSHSITVGEGGRVGPYRVDSMGVSPRNWCATPASRGSASAPVEKVSHGGGHGIDGVLGLWVLYTHG